MDNKYGSFDPSTGVTNTEKEAEKEDKRSWTYHELLLAFFCTLGPCSFGSSMALSSPTVPDLEERGIMTANQASLYESLLLLGALFGLLPTMWLVDGVGRRITNMVAAIPHGLGCALIFFARRNMTMYYAGRFSQGVAGGFWTMAFMIYVAETASKYTRGAMATGVQLGISTGTLSIYAFALVLGVRGLCVVCVAPTVVMVIGLLFMPESPRWLVRNNRMVEAIASLVWLRNNTVAGVESELEEIKTNIEIHEMSQRKWSSECLRQEIPLVWKPCLIGLALIMLTQVNGANVTLFNAQDIFADAGFHPSGGIFGPRSQALSFAVIKLIILIPAIFIIDIYGRRPLLFGGALTMCVTYMILAVFFHLGHAVTANYAWIAFVSLTINMSAADFSMGTIPWLVVSEIMPISVRGVATGVIEVISIGCGFLLLQVYHNMIAVITMAGVFWVFSAITFLATLFSCFVMPETKQNSLEEIEATLTGTNESEDNNEKLAN